MFSFAKTSLVSPCTVTREAYLNSVPWRQGVCEFVTAAAPEAPALSSCTGEATSRNGQNQGQACACTTFRAAPAGDKQCNASASSRLAGPSLYYCTRKHQSLKRRARLLPKPAASGSRSLYTDQCAVPWVDRYIQYKSALKEVLWICC